MPAVLTILEQSISLGLRVGYGYMIY